MNIYHGGGIYLEHKVDHNMWYLYKYCKLVCKGIKLRNKVFVNNRMVKVFGWKIDWAKK